MALTGEDLSQIKSIVTGAIVGLETRFDGLETRFDGLEAKVDRLDLKIDGLEKMLGEDYEAEVDRVTRVDGRLRKLRHDFNKHVSTQAD